MGYTCGRKHTDESLRLIARTYKTRSDFQMSDPSAYRLSLLRGHEFLDSICDHMVKGSYSTPQLICKHIMDNLLEMVCMYNTKKIIKPYELDIYYPIYHLAIEYNGKGWHFKREVIDRDILKREICKERNITLLTITETSRNYESDIKNQLIENLDIINKVTNNQFLDVDILNIECSSVYDYILKIKDFDTIKNKIKECSSVMEFQEKYTTEYNFLYRNKQMGLLNELRSYIKYTDNELMELCEKIVDYSDFLKNNYWLYQRCHKRKILKIATQHMKKTNGMCKNYTDDELLTMGKNFKHKSHIKKSNGSLFTELKNRKLLDEVEYNLDMEYSPTGLMSKKQKIDKCFEDALKYNNYNDFKNDEELYEKCVGYKIVRKISALFTH